jgi:hypothetical protein
VAGLGADGWTAPRDDVRRPLLGRRAGHETIYSDPARKDELGNLLRDQGSLKAEISSLEWNWMEASEALEAAGQADD